MKALLLAALLTVSFSSQADTVIKACNIELMNPLSETQELVQYRYEITQKGDKLKSIVTQEGSSEDPEISSARIGDYTIREDLTVDMLMDDENLELLNNGEKLIVGALFYAEKPEFDSMDVGFDLSLVRRVKTFFIGNEERDMSTTIVEALDSEGKLLGTFMGGVLAAPCK